LVFGFLLSGMMTLLVSGIAIVRAEGLTEDFLVRWGAAYVTAWPVAFPSVLLAAPLVRRLVKPLIVAEPGPERG